MSYLPQKNFNSETLVSSYDLTSGDTTLVSSDISNYSKFSLQFNVVDIRGLPNFDIEQSLDGVNWSYISQASVIPNGNSTFILDKQFFSGTKLRVCLNTGQNSSGTCTIILLTKR